MKYGEVGFHTHQAALLKKKKTHAVKLVLLILKTFVATYTTDDV